MSNLTVVEDSGNKLGFAFDEKSIEGNESVEFPFKYLVTYIALNKTRIATKHIIFQLVKNESGV